jgi:hypothetical protein
MANPPESIRHIVDQEAKKLSPEERERLSQRLAKYFVKGVMAIDSQSRESELTRFEEYVHSLPTLYVKDRQLMNEHLLMRRAELAARDEKFSEIADAIGMGQLNIIGLLLTDMQNYLDSPESYNDSPREIINKVLDLIVARRQEILNPTTEGGDDA